MQAEDKRERLKLQHQKRLQSASHLSRKQELERNQLLQLLNPPDTVFQDNCTALKTTQMSHSISKRVPMPKTREPFSKKEPSQKVARSETSLPARIIVLVITEKRKLFSILVAISVTEKHICI